MAKTIVNITDTLNTWREKTNDISIDVGDITLLTTDEDSDVVGSINSIDSNLGARENLTTNDKRSLVQAINELDSDVGDITTLDTETQASVVRAMNELELNHNKIDSDLGGSFGTNTPRAAIRTRTTSQNGFRYKQTFASALNELADSMGRGALTTTAQTVKGSLREHETDIGNMTFTGLSSTNISAAIRELRTEMGWHSSLTTAYTTDLVGAINELRARVDSVDEDIDQPVKTTSNVLFPQVTLGTQTGTDNSVYNNAGVTRTGDYTVDVSGDIVLDADNAKWTLKDGGTTRFEFSGTTDKTLSTSTGNFILDVGGNIELNADGATWTLKDATVNRWEFSGTSDKTLKTGTTGNLLLDVASNITLDADGGTVNLADNGTNQFSFIGGTNKEIDVPSGKLLFDVASDISFDAGTGTFRFLKNGSEVGRLAESDGDMLLEFDSHGLHIHSVDDIRIDAGGGDVIIEKDEVATFQFSGSGTGNKRLSVPSKSLLFDVAEALTLQSNTGSIALSRNGVSNIVYTFDSPNGSGHTISHLGTATFDIEGGLIIDVDGGSVAFKDNGNQFGELLVGNTNNLTIKSGSTNAIVFKNAASSKKSATFVGPVFLDSALRSDITGKSVAGSLNQLDTEVDTLQTLIGGTGSSYSITNLSSTTVKTQIQEIANELYASGTSFTGLSATNFKAAVNELRVEVGDITDIDSAIETADSGVVGAINSLHSYTLGVESTLTGLSTNVGSNLGNLGDLKTNAASLVGATNELYDTIGDSGSNLTTTAKTLIGAINELNAMSTDSVGEGSSNLYFTNTRARGAVSAANSGTGYGSLGYNSNTGVFTYTKVTDANIRGRFSAGEGIDLSATGEIKGEDATTTNKGIASFSSTYFSTSSGAVSIKDGGVDTNQLANDAVTYAKMQNVGTANRVLGSTAADGVVSEVQVQTGMIDNDAVTYSKIQNVATANRVLGSTSANGQVSEVQVQKAMIADGAVNSDKLFSAKTLLIKNSAGTTLFTITGAGA
jgi:hypothetical protein